MVVRLDATGRRTLKELTQESIKKSLEMNRSARRMQQAQSNNVQGKGGMAVWDGILSGRESDAL